MLGECRLEQFLFYKTLGRWGFSRRSLLIDLTHFLVSPPACRGWDLEERGYMPSVIHSGTTQINSPLSTQLGMGGRDGVIIRQRISLTSAAISEWSKAIISPLLVVMRQIDPCTTLHRWYCGIYSTLSSRRTFEGLLRD